MEKLKTAKSIAASSCPEYITRLSTFSPSSSVYNSWIVESRPGFLLSGMPHSLESQGQAALEPGWIDLRRGGQ